MGTIGPRDPAAGSAAGQRTGPRAAIGAPHPTRPLPKGSQQPAALDRYCSYSMKAYGHIRVWLTLPYLGHRRPGGPCGSTSRGNPRARSRHDESEGGRRLAALAL